MSQQITDTKPAGPILGFEGKWRFLSNFHPSRVQHEGITFDTVEHAFQAAKTLDVGRRILIAGEATPGKAKRAGRKVTLRGDWEDIKYGVMRTLVALKFMSNPDLALRLLATDDRHLAEENGWNDQLWGQTNGVGRNWLGLILMEVRAELRALDDTFASSRKARR